MSSTLDAPTAVTDSGAHDATFQQPPHRARWITDLSLLAMALIWGVNFSVVKYGTGQLAPLAFNSLRVTLAAVVLLLVAGLERRPWPSPRVRRRLILLGVLGNGLYQVFFVEGIARTQAGVAAILLSAAPAFIALIGWARGVEKVRLRGMIGIAASIGGIGLVVYGRNAQDAGRNTLLGLGLTLVASLCWSFYTVLLKPYTERATGLQLSALTMAGGAVPLGIAASGSLLHTDWMHVAPGAWAAIAYSGILALVVAYYFWYRGVRVIGPTRTAMYANLQPVIALLVGWIALSEVPTGWQGAGCAAIMAGLFLTR